MRFAGSLILGLLAINGLAQTAEPAPEAEPSAIAPQPAEPSAPAAEPSNPAPANPSDPAPANPSDPSSNDDTKPTDAKDQPSATGGNLKPTDEASQASGVDKPSATASNDDEDKNASTEAGPSATGDASATNDSPTATASGDDASDTATATATSSSAPTSTGVAVSVDLKNATIGENAQLVKVDGKPAVELNAPSNGQATFSVSVEADDDFKTDELIYIVASIRVGDASGSARLRRRDNTKTDCRLQMQADGQNVYDAPLYTNNGQFTDVTSNGIQSSDQPQVQITQKCGDKSSPLTVNNVRIGNEAAAKAISSGSGGSGSGGSGSGSGSGGKGGSGTATGTGASASATGDHGNLGSKTKASLGALAAAIMAAAAFV